MRLIFLIAAIFLIGCEQPSNNCNHPTGVIEFQSQTINLTNGGCTPTYTPQSVNGKNAESVTICGGVQGYVYQGLIYNPGITSNSTPLGFIVYPDNYMVFPTDGPNGTNQCWYKITQGQIDAGAANPTF